MKTVTRTYELFSFDELSEKAQEKVLEKHWDINCFDDWYECSIDSWKESLTEMGFESPEICFSGFSSQGDGACFDARVNLEVLIKHIDAKKYRRLVALAKESMFEMTIVKNSFGYHYSHANTRYIELDFHFNTDKYRKLYFLVKDLLEDVEDLRKNLSNEIYRDLEKEYEYLNSKASIIETLEANDYEFIVDGKLFR